MLMVSLAAGGWAQAPRPATPEPRRGGPARPAPEARFLTDAPPHPVDVILGRPTAGSVTLSVLSYANARLHVAYGTRPDELTGRTETRDCRAGEPVEFVVGSLQADTEYHYELRNAASDKPATPAARGRFHTQRPPGSTFTFTVQADSHLDERTDPNVYRQTLANVLADKADFHVDLGDTFMTDKHASRDEAHKQYLAQRYYLGLVGSSAPLFLALGNHDGEGSRTYDGTADSLAVWSNATRKRYFPNPLPDACYTGNRVKDRFAGLLQDYYAWQWGDGLFVVLDPFWYSFRRRGRDDNWARTLGSEQYNWLKRALEGSRARHKFIFVHHLVGGFDKQGRGGIEAVPFHEWGGKNADGTDGFQARRPGWDMPIHQLLVKHHVTAVFHGHDHFFCHQELDGIAYLLIPQPGQWNPRGRHSAREYGYRCGTSLPSSGYVRVGVSPEAVTVEYVRTLAQAPDGKQKGGQIAYRSALRPVSRDRTR